MSHNNLITINEASKRIGVSVVSLHGKKNTKYAKFRHKPDTSRVVMFDIDGFEKQETLNEQLKEKTKLFVEYLVHEENMTYQKIAEIARVKHHQTLSNLDFGFKIAYQIARAFAIHRPFAFKRFDLYYSWSHTPFKAPKVFR